MMFELLPSDLPTHSLSWKNSVSAHLLFKCREEMKDSFPLKLKRTENKQFQLNMSVCAKTSSAASCLLTFYSMSVPCDLLFNTIRCIGNWKESCIGLIGCNYYDLTPKIDFLYNAFLHGDKHNYNNLRRINWRTQSQRN